jgi:hypothetical protein
MNKQKGEKQQSGTVAMSGSESAVQRLVMPDLEGLEELFAEQYGDLACGGFLNPTVESDDGVDILFRCFYDNFDNEDDSWHYGYCRKSRQFYEA